MKNNIALIVGRFQPFHKGHLFLIKKALEKAEKIVVGIGSSNIEDVNNPIDFETRKKIIKAVFYKERLEKKLAKIVPLDDFFDDNKWLKNLEKQVGKFDLTLGNNDWTNNILKKAGYEVLKVNYCRRELYEGWRIRKLIRDGKSWQNRVPKYLVDFVSNYPLFTRRSLGEGGHPTPYNLVVLGGTFDRFHLGHKKLLEKAFEIGKKVTIGIATEDLYKDKLLSETIEPFELRKKSVKKYIKKYLIDGRLQDIISFSEFTGGADKIKEIDAIVVSKETLSNALKINELREKNKLHPLKIIIIEDILAEDGRLISSERIRVGEIDREGNIYQLSIANGNKNELIMPESLRQILQKPLGRVFKTVYQVIKFIKFIKPIAIIAVGDIIVDSLLKEGIDPDVKVIDFKSRRQPIEDLHGFKADSHRNRRKSASNQRESYSNKPGTIDLQTAEKLRQMIQERSVLVSESTFKVGPYGSWLVVDGEEDLLALPGILFAPLNSLVLYGHWQYGIIAVEVDEKIKNKVRNIVKKFL